MTQREAILKAVNSDAQKLLSSGDSSLSDSKRSKLRDTLQKCNDHSIKLSRKLREKESKEQKSDEDRVLEGLTNLSYTASTLQSSLAVLVKEPLPRNILVAGDMSNQHAVSHPPTVLHRLMCYSDSMRFVWVWVVLAYLLGFLKSRSHCCIAACKIRIL